MARNNMDKLSQDSCDALKAGMSYGKYMAMKGSANVTRPADLYPGEGLQERVCVHCAGQ